MNDKICVGYLTNIRDIFVVGSERCEGEALKYQQNFINALNYAIELINNTEKPKVAKLICTLRSTFPQVQPDIFKCSNCGCEEVRPHWKFCCNCGEQLTEIFYPSDKKEGTE